MQVHFDQDDFVGAQAVTTAAVMRALAQAIDPQEMAGPVTLAYTPGDASVLSSGPTAEVARSALAESSPQIAATTTVVSGPSEPVTVEWGEQAAPAGGVDAEGYPWDERIHASSRNTVADGTWRKKRGVDDALVAQVRAEWDAKLRGASSTPAQGATRYWHHPESSCVFKTEPGEPIGTDGCVEEVDEAAYLQLEREYATQRVPAGPTEAERLQADHVSTMPVDPATVGFGTAPAQVPPPPPVAPATGDAWPDDILGPRVDTMAPFPQFMAWAGKQIQAGTLGNARLLAVLQEHSVPILPALSAPEHVGKIPAIARQLAGA